MRDNGVDVVVITALKEEYDAARAAAGEVRWSDDDSDPLAPGATAEVPAGDRGTISVALARPVRMGGRGVGPIATALVERLRPACLAMSGVCAGRPGLTAPGDVVVASPAYEWDEGRHTPDGFLPAPQQFPLDSRWERAVQDFEPSDLPSFGAATDQDAAIWYLERLLKGQDPRTHRARARYFPPGTWNRRLARLADDGLIEWQRSRLVLTDAGRDHIQRELYLAVDGPERLPFVVEAGPMASGSAVVTDPRIWDHLNVAQRNILAVEMEAATIATIAHERRVPHWLIAKGVMDHADPDKDDRFKPFAAKASAEVLFALLGRLLRPAAAATSATRPAGVVPGRVKLEVVRRLTYDWQDLADIVGVPAHEARRFRPGDEPRGLWDWLADRDRLGDLPGALHRIGRGDLAGLLTPYL
ncbi:hypothetical protein [Actinoplanes sp. NPDC049265]|uniref:phosphorylase family protein n=1 Tax=Actinoplanes sp. NPDC049265 TaxID=3363902 RepID=UPI00372490D2